jgi:hypothetical protein
MCASVPLIRDFWFFVLAAWLAFAQSWRYLFHVSMFPCFHVFPAFLLSCLMMMQAMCRKLYHSGFLNFSGFSRFNSSSGFNFFSVRRSQA